MDIAQSPYTVLNWIAVLFANRTFELELEVAERVRTYFVENFLPPVVDADVIIGYRADDSYFSYAETFVNNGLSASRLNEAIRLGKLGIQIALKSAAAFAKLRFVRAEEVSWTKYHGRYVGRDETARKEWRERLRNLASPSSEFFANDIVRMGLRQGDERIREILST